MAFILLAAALVYLPFLAMLVVRQWPGPVSFVLFYFPPFTTIPLAAFGLGAAAGKNARRYGYVPVLVPLFFSLSSYGQICPLEMLSALLGLYLLLGAGGLLGCHFIRKFIGLRPGGSIHEKDL